MVHESALRLESVTKKELKETIKTKAQASLLRRSLDPSRAAHLSHTTIDKYVQAMGVKVVKQPSVQNLRRDEVKRKLFPI